METNNGLALTDTDKGQIDPRFARAVRQYAWAKTTSRPFWPV